MKLLKFINPLSNYRFGSQEPINLHIGCIQTRLDGYLNIDVRKTKATDIVANSWELQMFKSESVAHIYSRHTVEHLTLHDANKTFKEWYRVLKIGATINIIVPDLRFHAQQLLGITESNLNPPIKSTFEHAMAGLYGWQRKDRGGLVDLHKWGYTEESLNDTLKSHNFRNYKRDRDSETDFEPWHLNITVQK
jgi:predicted SAM-dependent methyltransferase